jgi:hypothetical protein
LDARDVIRDRPVLSGISSKTQENPPSKKKMGRRTNPLSLRVGGLLNWPSNVFSPFLNQYLKHCFQGALMSTPGLRSSTQGLWINLTVYGPLAKTKDHPLARNPQLSHLTQSADLSQALGRLETRLQNLSTGHHYFKDIFSPVPSKSLVEAGLSEFGPLGTLGLFLKENKKIHLRVNVVSNPLLNAEVLAQYTAHHLKEGKSLGSVYRELLQKMG